MQDLSLQDLYPFCFDLFPSCPVCRYCQTPQPVDGNKCFECDSNEVRMFSSSSLSNNKTVWPPSFSQRAITCRFSDIALLFFFKFHPPIRLDTRTCTRTTRDYFDCGTSLTSLGSLVFSLSFSCLELVDLPYMRSHRMW